MAQNADRKPSEDRSETGQEALRRRRQLPVNAPVLARVENAESSYTHFAYSYARSAEEAYAKEWCYYNAFGGSHGLDNEVEPILVVQSTKDLSANEAAAPVA